MKPRRGRRRWLIVAASLIVAILLGSYASYRLGLRPAASTGAARQFTVKAGERVPQVADNLKAAGLIRDRNAFITYVNLHGLRPRLQAGSYSLAPTMSGSQVAQILAQGHTAADRLVVPEGYTLAKIKALAAQQGLKAADFDGALRAKHDHSFLAGRPANVSLEGYLFPDSYQINASTTAAGLVNLMLDTFGQRVGADYVNAFKAQGLSLHQGLTLASIVEREVSIATDRPIVAQIFLTRLKMGMRLDSDVTVHYAADLLGVPFNLELNSPYNTRKVAGLPPGPICSPGLSALDAVAKPAHTNYLYFLSGKDGKTYFATTYEQHQQNIARHL